MTRELRGDEASGRRSPTRRFARSPTLGRRIEEHYGRAQDTEWASTPTDACMLQSRPVTPRPATSAGGGRRARGRAFSCAASAPPRAPAPGRARVVRALADGRTRSTTATILVTHMTAPDWVPLMRRAAAIVTDSGGMTCHAAIVSRELGIPCVVGTARGDDEAARRRDRHRRRGPGRRSRGREPEPAARPRPRTTASAAAPVTATKLLVNLSEPSQVERAAALDVEGVGLLRAELMVLEALEGKHPRLLLEEGRAGEFVDRMGEALTAFAAAFAPRPITYRTIDFRTNEFRGLEGGDRFEPEEANPMIGYRGRAALHARARPAPAGARRDRARLGRRATRTST